MPGPATTDAWSYFRVALANPETDTAIVSIGIEMDQDKGAHTAWFDDLKVTKNDPTLWRSLDRGQWGLDREARDLVLTSPAGYRLLKVIGGDKPTLLTSDSTVTEVPEDYLIARATALALIAGIGSPGMDAATRGKMADYWLAKAETDRRALTNLVGVRLLE